MSRFSFLDNLDKCLVSKKNLDCKQVKYKMLQMSSLLVLRR